MRGLETYPAHVGLPSGVHLDRAVDTRWLFSNSYFAQRFGTVVAKRVLERAGLLSRRGPHPRDLLVLGLGASSELMVATAAQILKKELSRTRVGHQCLKAIRSHPPSSGALSQLLANRSVVVVNPVACTLTSVSSALRYVRRAVGQNGSVLGPPLNIVLVAPEGMERGEKIWKPPSGSVASAYWKEVDFARSEVRARWPEERFEFVVPVPVTWHDPKTCPMCFPGKRERAIPTVRVNALDRERRAPVRPAQLEPASGTLAKPARTISPIPLEALSGSTRVGHFLRSANHHCVYVDSARVLRSQASEVEAWCRGVAAEIRGTIPKLDEKDVVLVCPADTGSADLFGIVNRVVFDDKALLVALDIESGRFAERGESIPSPLKNDVLVVFLDDAMCSGRSFHRAQSEIRLSRPDGRGVDAAIVLMNRLTPRVDALVRAAVGGRLFDWLRLRARTFSPAEVCPLCRKSGMRALVLQEAVLDSTRLVMARRIAKDGLVDPMEGRESERSDWETVLLQEPRAARPELYAIIEDGLAQFVDFATEGPTESPPLGQPTEVSELVDLFKGEQSRSEIESVVCSVVASGASRSSEEIRLAAHRFAVESFRRQLSTVPLFDEALQLAEWIQKTGHMLRVLADLDSPFLLSEAFLDELRGPYRELEAPVRLLGREARRLEARARRAHESQVVQRELEFSEVPRGQVVRQASLFFNHASVLVTTLLKEQVATRLDCALQLESSLTRLKETYRTETNAAWRALYRSLLVENVGPVRRLLKFLLNSRQVSDLLPTGLRTTELRAVLETRLDSIRNVEAEDAPILLLSASGDSILGQLKKVSALDNDDACVAMVQLFEKTQRDLAAPADGESFESRIVDLLNLYCRVAGAVAGETGAAVLLAKYGPSDAASDADIVAIGTKGLIGDLEVEDWRNTASLACLGAARNGGVPSVVSICEYLVTSEGVVDSSGNPSQLSDAQLFHPELAASHFLMIRLARPDAPTEDLGVLCLATQSADFVDPAVLRALLESRGRFAEILSDGLESPAYRSFRLQSARLAAIQGLQHGFIDHLNQIKKRALPKLSGESLRWFEVHYSLLCNRVLYLRIMNSRDHVSDQRAFLEKYHAAPNATNLSELVSETARFAQLVLEEPAGAHQKRARVEVKLPPTPVIAFVRGSVLLDVLMELVVNASRMIALAQQEFVLTMAIELEEESWVVVVRDNGPGMSRERLAVLNSRGRLKSAGGLEMSRTIWRASEGNEIRFCSEPGEYFEARLQVGRAHG